MASKVINGGTSVIAVISAIFFIVGCVGYADQREAAENTCWMKSREDGVQLLFGLSSVFVDEKNIGLKTSFDYGGESCPGDFCNECHRDGKATLGLLIVALIFAGLTAITSLLAVSIPAMQFTGIATSFISASFSLIGVGLFMSQCFDAIDDELTNTDLKWGPGSILSILGMLMMWNAVILQILAVVMGGDKTA